jgi:hypothetical protein
MIAVRGYDGAADRFLLESRLSMDPARKEVVV